MRTEEARPVRLKDYRPPDWLIETVELDVSLLSQQLLVGQDVGAQRTGVNPVYQTLQTDLSNLASSLESLSTSIDNPLATDAFATRAATISSTGDLSASSALSMTVNNGSATGDHTLTISQIATAQKVIGTSQSSETTALGYSGTFSLGLAGSSTSSVLIRVVLTMAMSARPPLRVVIFTRAVSPAR